MYLYDVEIYVHEKNNHWLYDCKTYSSKVKVANIISQQLYYYKTGHIEKTIDCYKADDI